MPNQLIDTTIIETYDSTLIVKNPMQQIILLKDFKKEPEKGLNDNPWIVLLLIPIIVAAIVAWIGYLLGKRKNKVEIEKLKEETKQLKKSFQPIVIATLQSVQEKILDKKIDALFELTSFRKKFTSFELEVDEEGGLIDPNEEFKLNQLWLNYNTNYMTEFDAYFHSIAYFFPDNIYNELGKTHDFIQSLDIDNRSYFDAFQDEFPVTINERNKIKEIIDQIDKCIYLIRKDCHLDSRIIHDFIEKNIIE